MNRCKCGGEAYIYKTGYANIIACEVCGETLIDVVEDGERLVEEWNMLNEKCDKKS